MTNAVQSDARVAAAHGGIGFDVSGAAFNLA
jgi:hypothetical protein